MTDSLNASRVAFAASAQVGGEPSAAEVLAARLKAHPNGPDMLALAALWMHAAAAAPEQIAAIYDASATGWLGEPIAAAAISTVPTAPASIPTAFWEGAWAILDAPRGSLGAGEITSRTAALGGALSPEIGPRAGQASLTYPGCAAAVAQGYPSQFTMEALARCPRESLGGEFHALIIDNNFDLEVLDRQALGLAQLPPPLGYLNARILQCHDLWHIIGGYRTTALHEVAISGFQLGQFGHHYSAVFLGLMLTRVAFAQPEAGALILDTVLTAWAHGRRSPPLLGVPWESIWDRPIDRVRQDLGVAPFVSPYPADLFEQLATAA